MNNYEKDQRGIYRWRNFFPLFNLQSNFQWQATNRHWYQLKLILLVLSAAFIEFEDEEGAKKALTLNTKLMINNVKIMIEKRDGNSKPVNI